MNAPKQPKNVQQSIYAPNSPVKKEPARIEDRPITMAPAASIAQARKFFQDKTQAQEARVRNRLAEGLPANVPTHAEIVAAVKSLGIPTEPDRLPAVRLTYVDEAGVERPTYELVLLLEKLRYE